LKTAVQTGKWARPDGTRATSLSPSFGAASSDGVPDMSSDELLGFLHLQHASGQSMSPFGRALFQSQFCTLNSILFMNISQYLKLTIISKDLRKKRNVREMQ
jgi:hypothetical protein